MRLLRASSWLSRQIKSWLFFLSVQMIYLALRRRSMKIRSGVATSIAILLHKACRGRRKRVEKNISLIRPDLNDDQIAQGSLGVARTLARSWAAMLGNEHTSPDEIAQRLEVEGIERLLEDHRAGKKIILTAAHVGPADEAFGIIPMYGLKVYVPVEPIKPQWLFNFMMRLRLHLEGIVYEPVEKGKTLARAAEHLSQGNMVLLAVDLPRLDESGVLCRIGKNVRAKFPVGAIKLALEQDATIFPVFPSWGNDWKVRVVFGPPFNLIRTGDKNRDIEINTRWLIEKVYAPHIRKHYDSWLRLLWVKLELAE